MRFLRRKQKRFVNQTLQKRQLFSKNINFQAWKGRKKPKTQLEVAKKEK